MRIHVLRCTAVESPTMMFTVGEEYIGRPAGSGAVLSIHDNHGFERFIPADTLRFPLGGDYELGRYGGLIDRFARFEEVYEPYTEGA